MIVVDLSDLQKYEQTLSDPKSYMGDRVDSLFCIKAFNEVEAIDSLIRAFKKEQSSELLKHEICYVLGQMNKTEAHVAKIQQFLEMVIEEKNGYQDIVVHEAVEALGNLSNEVTLDLIKRFDDPEKTNVMVFETCFLAKELINWNKVTNHGQSENINFKELKFSTNDPAPTFNIYGPTAEKKHLDVRYLESMLINKQEGKDFDLFQRYRALFTLREINTAESCVAICSTLKAENMDSCGALLKHEVAYVLAQMETVNSHSIPFLLESVLNDEEAPIVRHEALIAVGEMIDEKTQLAHLLEHSEDIVRESAEVACRNIDNRLAENQYWLNK